MGVKKARGEVLCAFAGMASLALGSGLCGCRGACGLCLGSGVRRGRALPSGVCPAGGLRRRFACGFGFGFGLFVAVLLVSWD